MFSVIMTKANMLNLWNISYQNIYSNIFIVMAIQTTSKMIEALFENSENSFNVTVSNLLCFNCVW